MMTSMTQFAAVNPAISLAAMHARMVVFAQDEQGHLKACRRGAPRQGLQLPMPGLWRSADRAPRRHQGALLRARVRY
jgi:hypothetical protein